MFFFNLSLTEFLALFAGVSGVVAALYLLDRTRQKHRVATLRFWNHSDAPSEMQHRRKIQQPWSLLLQILSMLLLLLALAQLRWGSPLSMTRDHVLILDTSAVMDARIGPSTWMDQARTLAKAWLSKVPKGDRVMLIRADALPTAATAFETNHQIVEEAIAQSSANAPALHLDSALRFARQAQQMHGKGAGEIVFAGAGRVAEEDSGFAASLTNLRVLPVKGELQNVGLRKIGLRRSPKDEHLWEVYVTVGNEGTLPRTVPVGLLFGKALVAQRTVTVPPGSEQSFTTELKTEAAGFLEARIQVNDSFPDDNRATLELPSQNPLKILVFSADPSLLKPIFSHPRFDAEYRKPADYRPDVDAAVVVLDRMGVAAPTKAPAIWIDPPKGGSPVAVASTKASADITRWHNENSLGAGLRARDVKLTDVSVFESKAGDIPVADVAAGPVILARPSQRLVVLGFHPMQSPLRFELATPLLFANILKSLAPDAFLRWELNAGSAGSVIVPLESEPTPGSMKVTMDGGGAIPFTIEGRTLRFFSGAPGVVRINDGRREMVYSLTLPEVASTVWKAPASARTGVPASIEGSPIARDLWQWLAIAGGLGLAAEWILFGRSRRLFRMAAQRTERSTLRKAS